MLSLISSFWRQLIYRKRENLWKYPASHRRFTSSRLLVTVPLATSNLQRASPSLDNICANYYYFTKAIGGICVSCLWASVLRNQPKNILKQMKRPSPTRKQLIDDFKTNGSYPFLSGQYQATHCELEHIVQQPEIKSNQIWSSWGMLWSWRSHLEQPESWFPSFLNLLSIINSTVLGPNWMSQMHSELYVGKLCKCIR